VPQGDFVNAAAGLLTQLTSERLLNELAAIEVASGRPAVHQHWGPRTLDLDLLVFGREQHAQAALTLPHPGIVERNFVLYPLADFAPDLEIPGIGRVARLLGRVSADGLWPLTQSTPAHD
jgi:2-amino-4-hydroxy-6-hydroxymethyldihydropteridine diphosphokinase